MKQIIDYIIRFLLYGNQDAAKLVAYTADESQWHNYRVVIVPNGHLGKDIVLPDLSDLQITHHCHTTATQPQHNRNTTATPLPHHPHGYHLQHLLFYLACGGSDQSPTR